MSKQEQTNETPVETVSKRPTKHAVIMRGVVTPILGLLAVACVVLGVLNATEWKPSAEVTATAKTSGVQYIVTDPGVLSVVDDRAKMTVKSTASDEVCVALGSATDVAGWVSGQKYVRVTGLNSWTELSVSDAKSHGKDTTGDGDVAFKDSDMWSRVTCGDGSVTITTKSADDSRVALVDLGESGSADVSMHWTRSTLPDFAMPFYFAGGLLAIMAILAASVFAMPPHKRRKRVIEAAADAADEVRVGEAIAGSFGMRSTAGRGTKSGPKRKRRRHAAGSASVETTAAPVIVDPSSRNLVAENSGDSAADAAKDGEANVGEQTSVISPDELQAYFARLAAEVGEPNASDNATNGTADDKGEER